MLVEPLGLPYLRNAVSYYSRYSTLGIKVLFEQDIRALKSILSVTVGPNVRCLWSAWHLLS